MSERIGPPLADRKPRSRSKRERDCPPDDLQSLFIHVMKLVPWKIATLVFVMYIVINTTVFTEKILAYWCGALDGRYPTDKGIILQAAMLTITVVVFSLLCEAGLV